MIRKKVQFCFSTVWKHMEALIGIEPILRALIGLKLAMTSPTANRQTDCLSSYSSASTSKLSRKVIKVDRHLAESKLQIDRGRKLDQTWFEKQELGITRLDGNGNGNNQVTILN